MKSPLSLSYSASKYPVLNVSLNKNQKLALLFSFLLSCFSLFRFLNFFFLLFCLSPFRKNIITLSYYKKIVKTFFFPFYEILFLRIFFSSLTCSFLSSEVKFENIGSVSVYSVYKKNLQCKNTP